MKKLAHTTETPMIASEIHPNLYMVTYRIPTGSVNAYIIRTADGLVLVDTGYTDSGRRMLAAIQELGHQPADVRHILVTHAHSDHVGSLAALKRATGAPASIHPLDVNMAQTGNALRDHTHGTPGWPNKLAFEMGVRMLARTVEPADVEYMVQDGDLLELAGGIRVIHIPGHSAGQVAFLWQAQGVLFAADAVANLFGRLRYGPVVEDFPSHQASIKRLCDFDFDVACFGHGKPLTEHASATFRQTWQPLI
jgi:glyoxylase-like metal-dependent hydrolase (beta-lactamase superfamily II)